MSDVRHIDANALKEAFIKTPCYHGSEGSWIPLKDAFDVIDNAPTIEPPTKYVAEIRVDAEEIVQRIKEEYEIVDGWIPCEERLPNIGEWVLITIADCEYPVRQGKRVDLFNSGATAWCVETITGYLDDEDVLAWIPLPQEYKGACK